jgi:hypothetical protein
LQRDRMNAMIGRPQAAEAAPYYFTYIDQVAVKILSLPLRISLKSICHSYARSRKKNRCTGTHQTSGVSGRC